MTNEAAERLRSYLAADFFDKKVPKGYLERIDAALAAERKATVERIRAVEARFAELKETSLMPNSPLWTAGSRASFALAEGLLHAAILDAEAAR